MLVCIRTVESSFMLIEMVFDRTRRGDMSEKRDAILT